MILVINLLLLANWRLLKLQVSNQTRAEIYSVIQPFRASVIDVSKDSLTVQITGEFDKLKHLLS